MGAQRPASVGVATWGAVAAVGVTALTAALTVVLHDALVAAWSRGRTDVTAVQPPAFSPVADRFYISGQVKAPGSFPVTSGLTFRMTIAKGGGVGENGSEKKLKVVRKGEKLKKVKLDALAQPGDIITIGERLF